ncbi:hypothetical protein THIOKS11520002 [Thiocapsa sp. KS1]|nr:hypothetical protein THIOKS11520002 [Thiocapsa sp. KS1]
MLGIPCTLPVLPDSSLGDPEAAPDLAIRCGGVVPDERADLGRAVFSVDVIGTMDLGHSVFTLRYGLRLACVWSHRRGAFSFRR